MPPETELLYPRPTDLEISQTADRLAKIEDVTPETWMRRLETLADRKGGLKARLPDWMERMLEYGMFAGWEADDLKKLRGLLIAKQGRADISALGTPKN